MKKILSIAIVLCIITGFAVNTFAVDYGEAQQNISKSTYKQIFSDVPTNHWAYAYISEMSTRGVLNGYSDGTFRPDNQVTRAEAAKMIAVIEGIYKTDYYENLADVTSKDWHAPYIYGVRSYFNTYELPVGGGRYPAYADFFFPDSIVEREDVVVALMKQYDEVSSSEVTENMLDGFSDGYEVSEEKREYFEEAISNGIISGYEDHTLRPHNGLTRAEMATMLCKLYGAFSSADIIKGEKGVQFNCSIDNFINRYNKNLADNYNRVAKNDTKNLLQSKRYELNKSLLVEVSFERIIYGASNSSINASLYGENYHYYMIGETAIVTDMNKNIKMLSLDFSKSSDSYFDEYSYRKYMSPAKYQAICAIMALGNISYDDAFSLLNAIIYNRNFLMSNQYALIMNEDSFIVAHIDDNVTLKNQASIGKLLPPVSNNSVPAMSCNVTQFISTYNKHLYENFHRITKDVRYTVPEDYLLSGNSIVGVAKSSYLGSIDVNTNIYVAGLSSDCVLICNTENQIMFLTINAGNRYYNKDIAQLDIFNLQQICAIMTIENISFDEAKAYCFASINDDLVFGEKAIYETKGFEFKATSADFYVYAQNNNK